VETARGPGEAEADETAREISVKTGLADAVAADDINLASLMNAGESSGNALKFEK